MKTKAKGVAHVVTAGKGFGCLHCGEEYPLVYPIRLDMWGASAKAFEKLHKHCKPSEAGRARLKFSTPDEWIDSWDTGISSKTLWAFFTGRHGEVRERGVPYDPADFGRCHRLLTKFPDWRERLPEFAVQHPEWDGLVSRWADLEKLYEEELPSGKCPKLYALMQALLGKGAPS